MGKTPVPTMKNGRNPPSIKKHTRGPGAFGRGSMGEISGSQMKNGRDLLYTKRERKKGKRGRELEKTLASSKILTHGLGSLKGSPQCDRKKRGTAQRRSRCLDLVSSIISKELKVKKKKRCLDLISIIISIEVKVEV